VKIAKHDQKNGEYEFWVVDGGGIKANVLKAGIDQGKVLLFDIFQAPTFSHRGLENHKNIEIIFVDLPRTSGVKHGVKNKQQFHKQNNVFYIAHALTLFVVLRQKPYVQGYSFIAAKLLDVTSAMLGAKSLAPTGIDIKDKPGSLFPFFNHVMTDELLAWADPGLPNFPNFLRVILDMFPQAGGNFLMSPSFSFSKMFAYSELKTSDWIKFMNSFSQSKDKLLFFENIWRHLYSKLSDAEYPDEELPSTWFAFAAKKLPALPASAGEPGQPHEIQAAGDARNG
jgi:hypothetical protein